MYMYINTSEAFEGIIMKKILITTCIGTTIVWKVCMCQRKYYTISTSIKIEKAHENV